MFKKICYITSYRSDYAKVKPLISALSSDPYFDLKIIAAGSHPLKRYGYTIADLFEDGIQVDKVIDHFIDGSSLPTMIKTSALLLYELAGIIDEMSLDLGLIVGDRFDILPAAYALSLMNIPVAHIQGGETTGTIDDMIRNVITKFSHIHFAATSKSRQNIIELGEDSKHVYHVGCPSIDYITNLPNKEDVDNSILQRFCKTKINLSRSDKYFMVLVHPNVVDKNDIDVNELFTSLDLFHNKKIVFYPNSDPFNQEIIEYISKRDDYIKFKHIPMDCFMMLLENAACMIGNSSSGIREAGLFGVPVIDIGSRQEGRERGSNVINVPCKSENIVAAITKVKDIKLEINSVYGNGTATDQIIEVLKSYTTFCYKNVRMAT